MENLDVKEVLTLISIVGGAIWIVNRYIGASIKSVYKYINEDIRREIEKNQDNITENKVKIGKLEQSNEEMKEQMKELRGDVKEMIVKMGDNFQATRNDIKLLSDKVTVLSANCKK